jgi:hypothetical protein
MANRTDDDATRHVQAMTDELAAKKDELRALVGPSRKLQARRKELRDAEDEAARQGGPTKSEQP